jgi:hypothetical protein
VIGTSWFIQSDLKCNPIERFTGAYGARRPIGCVREIALVTGDDVIRLGGRRAF